MRNIASTNAPYDARQRAVAPPTVELVVLSGVPAASVVGVVATVVAVVAVSRGRAPAMTSPAAAAAIAVTSAPVMIRTRRRRRAPRVVRRWRRWEEPSVARSRLVVVPVFVDADYAGSAARSSCVRYR